MRSEIDVAGCRNSYRHHAVLNSHIATYFPGFKLMLYYSSDVPVFEPLFSSAGVQASVTERSPEGELGTTENYIFNFQVNSIVLSCTSISSQLITEICPCISACTNRY